MTKAEVEFWSKRLAEEDFLSESDARRRVFKLREHDVRADWNTPDDAITHIESRFFADTMPLYRCGDRWKVGRPVAEYLTMTSDFSDGTNGEPTAYPPSGGGAGSTVGLPDYKYYERLKKRREKLNALKQRRDPDGILGDRVLGENAAWIGPVYHASPEQFSTFDTSKEGAHFGTFEQASNLRKPGKKAPKAYYLSIQNLLRLRDIGVWNNFNNLHSTLSVEGHITDQQADEAWDAWQRSDDEGWETLKQALRQNGYDGIVYQNEQEGEGDSYLAFWSSQIKPARGVQEHDVR